jgi:hypothetical protein
VHGCIYKIEARAHLARRNSFLEKADAWSPVVLCDSLRVHYYLVGERVRVGRGNGRDVVFVAVHNGDDFVRSFLE